jgi:hypothetical protein
MARAGVQPRIAERMNNTPSWLSELMTSDAHLDSPAVRQAVDQATQCWSRGDREGAVGSLHDAIELSRREGRESRARALLRAAAAVEHLPIELPTRGRAPASRLEATVEMDVREHRGASQRPSGPPTLSSLPIGLPPMRAVRVAVRPAPGRKLDVVELDPSDPLPEGTQEAMLVVLWPGAR